MRSKKFAFSYSLFYLQLYIIMTINIASMTKDLEQKLKNLTATVYIVKAESPHTDGNLAILCVRS